MKKTNKILALALALLMVLSLFPVTAFADTSTPAQKPNDAVTNGGNAIYDAKDFLAIKDNPTGSYYLANNIDLSNATKPTDYYYVQYFNGVLDGRNHTISGINIDYDAGNATGEIHAGLFEYLGYKNEGGSAVIKDLKIGSTTNPAVIKVTDTVASCSQAVQVGTLAGQVHNYGAVLSNVAVYSDITVELDTKKDAVVGGLIGFCCKLEATDCSYTGNMNVYRAAGASIYVGGFAGTLYKDSRYHSTFKNCVNNGNVDVTVDADSTFSGFGGFAGVTAQRFTAINCVNNGTVTITNTTATSLETNSAEIVGGIWSNSSSILVAFINCQVLGSANAKLYNDATTWADASYTLRTFIYGCTDEDGVLDANLPIYNAATMPNATAGEVIVPIQTATEFKNIGTGGLYSDTGFYMLNGEDGVIEFEDSPISQYAVENFNGVLWGNNNVLTNVNITQTAVNDTGLFKHIAASDDALLFDFTIGTKAVPATLTVSQTGKSAGVLSACIGKKTTVGTNQYYSSDADVHNVDIYATVTIQNVKVNFGVMTGFTYTNYSVYDSDVNGTVTAEAPTGTEQNISGFMGVANGDLGHEAGAMFMNCNNFVDVQVDSTGATNLRVSGFLGYSTTYGSVFIDCGNYGSIVNTGTLGAPQISVFIAIANRSGNSRVLVHDCENFGSLNNNGVGSCGTVVGYVNGNHKVITISSLKDYASTECNTIGYSVSTNTGTVNTYDYVYETAISMGKGGASIRIDPDVEDAGLRFKGYVSTEAIAALKEEFGADATVSYGMLITPTLFAEKAGGFTADKLDTWAGSAAMKDQFGTDKAYVDVVATPDTWYKGETGLFAASLNGIQNMLTTAFSGRAYIKVAVNGNTVCTLYAAYADANNSRVFTEILSLALRDVLYTNDNGTTWYTDEACTTAPDLTMVDPAKYTTNLSEETATVKKYTCYTKAQYDDLTTLSGRISQ